MGRQTPLQTPLPFEPPIEASRPPGENPADEVPLDRFTSILLQEVVRRSVALELRSRRKPRTAA